MMMTVNEPVLIIAFNRPDHLSALIDRLREIKPRNVYIAIDGPRGASDEAQVRECQALASSIDWTGEVHTQFQDTNLGCGRGVTAAIDWFFANVDRGIILEDDIIPEPSFFDFCTELLDRYENDERVFAISGCNPVPSYAQENPEAAYRFAQVTHVWGWATWKRSWQHYQLDMEGWYRQLPIRNFWKSTGRSIPGSLFWAGNFEAVRRGDVDTWDWPMIFSSMRAGQLTATSNVNLVTNIGFGANATHTHSGVPDLMPVGEARLPTTAIPVQVDRKAEAWTLEQHWNATYLGTLDRLRKLATLKGGRT